MPNSPRRLFAVIPAAGLSRRMGRPKLLLPLGETTVIGRLLAALDHPRIAERFVVVRPDDEALSAEAERHGATVVRPESPPPAMRESVEAALGAIRSKHEPEAGDGWLLVPGDHPVLDRELIGTLIDRWDHEECEILVPRCDNRRGHPAFFRWALAAEVASIPKDQGLNRLLKTHTDRLREADVQNRAVLIDLDTPGDYEALLADWGNRGFA